MPPTDRFVISYAAEPPQETLPYGRWADTLRERFLGAIRELDTEGEEIGEPGEFDHLSDYDLLHAIRERFARLPEEIRLDAEIDEETRLASAPGTDITH